MHVMGPYRECRKIMFTIISGTQTLFSMIIQGQSYYPPITEVETNFMKWQQNYADVNLKQAFSK